MSDGVAIRIPLEYVNDEKVKFLGWVVEEGQEVREGQTLAEVETSKALVELTAVTSGRVWRQARAGEEVPVGGIIGYISKNGSSAPRVEPGLTQSEEAKTADQGAVEELPADTRFSKKALELLRLKGVSATAFAGRGIVREQDVLEVLKREQRQEVSPSGAHFALEQISMQGVSLPVTFPDRERGKVDAQFLMELRKDSDAFGRLSSDEKCDVYRKKGAVVGNGVLLGDGAVVIAPQIVIGDRVHIGENSLVQCRERFLAGQLTSFRGGLSVRGGVVVLGENVFGGRNVQIGGGGHGDPWSMLSVGNGTYIGDDVFVNICRPVLIGKEVFLTQRSILVTHNIGHSILEGYENRFAPIVLEDYSQVGMNSTIYAGSRIGRGSIVGSNSYVISSIPPGKIAVGVPARVIRDATRPLDRQRQIEIVHGMVREYHELLMRKGYEVSPQRVAPFRFELQYMGKHFQLCFLESCNGGSIPLEPMDESIIWTLESNREEPLPGFTVIDLIGKRFLGDGGIFAESTREFVRKRGIRLEPGPWRYQKGLI
jgi:acetyltransferase-like isoleucine patch superfamily enzyme